MAWIVAWGSDAPPVGEVIAGAAPALRCAQPPAWLARGRSSPFTGKVPWGLTEASDTYVLTLGVAAAGSCLGIAFETVPGFVIGPQALPRRAPLMPMDTQTPEVMSGRVKGWGIHVRRESGFLRSSTLFYV